MNSQQKKLKLISIPVVGLFVLITCLFLFRQVSAQDTAAKKITDAKIAVNQLITQLKKTVYQPQQTEILDYRFQELAPSDTQSAQYKKHIITANYKILLLISHPKDFLLQRPSDNSPLILFADGFPLTGMTTEYFTQIRKNDVVDSTKFWPDKMWIPFFFKRDSTTKDAWNNLFRMAHWNDHAISFDLSLGWSGMFPLDNIKTSNSRVTLIFYQKETFWFLLLGYLIFIMYFVYLCYSTGLIREPDVIKVDNTILKGPFSLAQTQLAFWTVITIGGFIYLILLTGLADSLNDSILLLLGISGGTTGVAGFIDYYKKQPKNQIDNVLVPKQHRSFLLDILSDGVNVSMQRTQIVLWNLVMGGYFLWYVITNKSMPVFNNTLLVLAGVSSVLYLGSKGPENSKPAPTTQQL